MIFVDKLIKRAKKDGN
jgi:SWI/SNF-related matrix-associated actin-dependent regulator of chromatin subfamily A member 5